MKTRKDLSKTLVPIGPQTKFKDLGNNSVLSQYDRHNFGTPVREITKNVTEGNHARVLVVDQIQQNGMKSQSGLTLHHSEMESYYFAKRHGWDIVKIIIDRDCCPVCGSTLGKIAPEVHAGICFYQEFLNPKKEVKEEKKVKVEQEEFFSIETEVEEKIRVEEEYPFIETTPFEEKTPVAELPPVENTIFNFEMPQTGEDDFDWGLTQPKQNVSDSQKTNAMEEEENF